MQAIFSLGLGYLIGSVSPAALLGWIKNVDLKEEGTKNLGATNTMILLGRSAGVFVMLFDIFKSFLSARLVKVLFPHLAIAGMLACIGTIIGHCFPLFLHFQGGKGLAAFGGMVLAYKPWVFLAILCPGLILMAILDTGVALPMFGGVMFPVIVFFYRHDIPETLCALAAGILLVVMHWGNLKKAWENKDFMKVNSFLKDILFKKD